MVDASGSCEGDALLATSRGGIVSARGTSEGVVLRLDGRVPDETLRVALTEFMNPRKTFLGGQEVALEWIGVRPEGELVSKLTDLLIEDFGVSVRTSKLREQSSASAIHSNVAPIPLSQTPQREAAPIISSSDEDDYSDAEEESLQEQMGLFGGIGDMDDTTTTGKETKRATQKSSLADPSLWDDPDARIIYSTLRSGQLIQSEHSVIIVGDVNPGAEILAGGDVIVLGSLRGVAHAGAYDETGGGRTIFALSLQPTQLRIGTTISRGSPDGGKVPEVAKIEGNMIVVEPFMKKGGTRRW